MIFTLDQAYQFCRPYIDGGTCNQILGYARINEAVRRMLPKTNSSRLIHKIRMVVRNSEFALPREAEKVLWVDANGTPGSVFGRPYEFLQHGPGDFAYQSLVGVANQLADLGEHPYMYSLPGLYGWDDDNFTNDSATNRDDDDYPGGFMLCAFSEFSADVGKEITIEGANELAMDIRTSNGTGVSTPGTVIKINQYAGGVEGTISGTWADLYHSSVNFRDIYQIRKPVTEGYITIYAVYEATSEMWLVGKYHPDETIPMFRRYRITSKPYSRLNPGCSNLLMLVKMRYIPLTRGTDIVPLDSLDALKIMCMAITRENAQDLQGAVLHEQNAERVMKSEIDQKEIAPSAPAVIDLLRETSARSLFRGGGLQ